ncbi:C2 family cysteine protease [Mycolicibacterium sp. BiH015]|uniref:C2 family cysteine protease n=1 Tax=Mycolicibacterium sp. BiH015 TaxID=3018808 RepID=UPI0022E76E9D|nr:C2 family cysteine protease [Mycolicibacterium sp. BiH015]MDA2894293.1 C2 family cysteine protease [Mycolicibacterium sp. BiH015]
MVATLSIVEGTQPSRLLDSARQQDEKVAALAAHTAELQSELDALRAAWHGGAADAAIARAEADLTRHRRLHATLTNYAAALRYGGVNLDPLRSQILAMAAQARALGGMVGDDGSVWGHDTLGMMSPTLAGAYTTSLKTMLSWFARIDDTVAEAVRSGSAVPQTPVPTLKWGDDDLYDGDPKGSDVNQDGIGDCYLVATMSSIANANPQWIKDRISYDPYTGLFDVTLWDGREWRHIPVTQADIDANIAQHGASGVDNNVPGAPLWPAVLESAYAKMKTSGTELTKIQSGVTPPALEALTGNNGDWIFPATEWMSPSQNIDTRIADALAGNQPVMLSTSIFTKDSVAPMHVYSIEGITGTGSDATVTLRNPWGPGSELPPVFDVRLGDLIGTDPLGGVGLGPTAMINIGRMGS